MLNLCSHGLSYTIILTTPASISPKLKLVNHNNHPSQLLYIVTRVFDVESTLSQLSMECWWRSKFKGLKFPLQCLAELFLQQLFHHIPRSHSLNGKCVQSKMGHIISNIGGTGKNSLAEDFLKEGHRHHDHETEVTDV